MTKRIRFVINDYLKENPRVDKMQKAREELRAVQVTAALKISTIGIGAGSDVDGQVLVMHDMLGINKNFSPRFLRRYEDLHSIISNAVQKYISDVKEKTFPNENESY